MKNCAVILTEKKETQTPSSKPDIMTMLLFRPMLLRIADAVKDAGIEDIFIITDGKCESVEAYIESKSKKKIPKKHNKTNQAVIQAAELIKNHSGGNALILSGNTPLLDSETLISSLKYHTEGDFLQTTVISKADKSLSFKKTDNTASNKLYSPVIWFDCDTLADLLTNAKADNSTDEVFISDVIEKASETSKRTGIFITENAEVLLSADSAEQLYELNERLRMQLLGKFMLNGVSIPCTDGVIIDESAVIGKNTVILPGTVIKEGCRIGSGCEIGPSTVLYKTTVGNDSILNFVQAEKAVIGDLVTAGPFVHIRPDSILKDGVHCGNFTEIKNSTIGEKTSVSHLTYIGDSDVGSGVNFGCGTVTVNFNGKEKNRCNIGNDAFIGCNTNLIAPVSVGERAYTAAGSTITEDIPDDALAIARQRQVNKENWVKIKKPYRKKK